jgi:hypothetical protein
MLNIFDQNIISLCNIIVKTLSIEKKKRILKSAREKHHVTIKANS